MLDWFRSGGFNMYTLAALGIVMVATAVRFARNADAQRLSIVRALTWALIAMTLTGFVSGLVSTCRYVVDHPEALKEPVPYLLIGFSESCANIVLGGCIAVITWTLVAVGVRRMPHDPS
jgi:hypothetical protein